MFFFIKYVFYVDEKNMAGTAYGNTVFCKSFEYFPVFMSENALHSFLLHKNFFPSLRLLMNILQG